MACAVAPVPGVPVGTAGQPRQQVGKELVLDLAVRRVGPTVPQFVSVLPQVIQLATVDESEILVQVAAMRRRARRLGGDVDLMARLDRVEGVILWQIAEGVPDRARMLGAEAERMLQLLAQSRDRVARIANAANAIGTPDSVSGRILAMGDRIDALLFDTERALDWTGQTLIARIHQGLRHEMAWLDQHLTYTRLAVARIGDAGLLASAETFE